MENKHYPKCFSSRRQYITWVILARASRLEGDEDGTNSGYSGYCIDCTPQYQLRMKAYGRCNHPQTKFHKRRLTQGKTTYIEIIGRRPAARTRVKVTKKTSKALALSPLPS